MWITTNVVIWIAPMGGGNVDYHKYINSPIIIIKNNIN